MTMTVKFDNDVAPWLRLLTPVLMVLAMFILQNINANLTMMSVQISEIGAEQARRTIQVHDSYQHIKDWKIHRRVD